MLSQNELIPMKSAPVKEEQSFVCSSTGVQLLVKLQSDCLTEICDLHSMLHRLPL